MSINKKKEEMPFERAVSFDGEVAQDNNKILIQWPSEPIYSEVSLKKKQS